MLAIGAMIIAVFFDNSPGDSVVGAIFASFLLGYYSTIGSGSKAARTPLRGMCGGTALSPSGGDARV